MKSNEFDSVIIAWKEASQDLKINIKSPFFLETDNGKIEYPMLIEKFGRKNGTIILNINDMDRFAKPEQYGFYRSALNPVSYGIYNREKFIDTLEDWGYFGDENERPNWFLGKYYIE